jgi:hypothetical protein
MVSATAVIFVVELRVNFADVVPSLTAVTPVKFKPRIVTRWAAWPDAGEKPLMVGGGMTVKADELVVMPPGVFTEIGPVVAPARSVAEAVVFGGGSSTIDWPERFI